MISNYRKSGIPDPDFMDFSRYFPDFLSELAIMTILDAILDMKYNSNPTKTVKHC